MRHIIKFRPPGDPLWQIWTWNPLILWVTDIRLKETDPEASRCRNIDFYRKKTQMIQINDDLDIVIDACKGIIYS